MPKNDARSGNPAKKAAAVADIKDAPSRKVHKIKPKGEVSYFEFELPDDETVYRIPLMQFLTLEQVDALDNDDSITGVLELFGEDEKTLAAIRELNGVQLNEFMDAWRDASAMGLGES